MRLLIKERGQGKTTGLIYTSEATGYPIVVATKVQADYTEDMAKRLKCNIPKPVTVRELREGRKRGSRIYENVLIDDVNIILNEALNEYLGCTVECATMTDLLRM